MNCDELLQALRRLAPETGSLACLGCGHEHRCSTHGCAIIRAAVEEIETLAAHDSNDPLTLEELREMDDGTVWVESLVHNKSRYALVGKKCCINFHESFSFDDYGKTWLAYRQKPEEGGERDN